MSLFAAERMLLVPGRPTPKARARVTTRGSRPGGHTPDGTAGAEDLIRGLWLEAHGRDPLAGPVGVRLLFCYGPEPYTRITVFPLSGMTWEGGRGDLDNCVKTVLDALTRVAYQDDRQVAWLEVEKVRTTQV